MTIYLWNAVILDLWSTEAAAAQFHQCIVTNKCLFRQTFLIVFVWTLSARENTMKTCTAAVTCKHISRFNLRLRACVATTAMLSKSPRLWMHLCCCIICTQVRYRIAHSICPENEKWTLAGAASRSLRNFLSFLSSCRTRTTSFTFTQEQCGSTGAGYYVNAQPVSTLGPSLSRVRLIPHRAQSLS